MASTTFNGPVRSEKGFQVATKNATTGAVTTRMSSAMPDLTGLAKADVATGASLTLAADTMSIVNYTGAAAAGCTPRFCICRWSLRRKSSVRLGAPGRVAPVIRGRGMG